MQDEQEDQICKYLKFNEACLTIQSTASRALQLWTQSSECEGCPGLFQREISPRNNLTLKVNTSAETNLTFIEDTSADMFCSQMYNFEEFGNYLMVVEENKEESERCLIMTIEEPSNSCIPIVAAVVVYLGLALIWIVGKYLYRQEICLNLLGKKKVLEICTIEKENSQQAVPPQRKRLRSLDTFRGIALVVMIFVNYGGGKYWFFEHVPWNGLYLADLVFPWFIWTMGVSMAFSTRSLLRKSVPRWKILKKILKRSCILFALGIILNTYGGYNNLQKIRIPGVLQRFGISYFVVASVHMLFAKPNDIHQKTKLASVRDILSYWLEWLIMLCILLTHILLTFFLEVPGCPKGYLGPGGIHNGGAYFNCTGGAAGYIDRIILGEAHIYQHPTIKGIYLTELPYDPEGILGFLTSIFLVFLGLQAGKILLIYQEWKSRLVRWFIWGTVIGLIAIILSKATKNDGWIPINKNLWSVSFIFATGAMCFFFLSILYYVIDVKKWWTGAPFFFSGMNSILLYVGHSLTGELFPWTWHVGQTHWDHLAVDLWGTTLWVIISIWLYYEKFFLAV